MGIHISSGAVIYTIEHGVVKVVLLHRKSTNSWHLPKGTQNPGETLEQTAIREIHEETGLNVVLGNYIGKLDSVFEKGGISVQKETHYFLAQSSGGSFLEHDIEHDQVCFLEYSTALDHLENFSLYEQEGKILKMAEQCFV